MESSNQAKSILLTPTDIDRLTDRIKELEDALAEEIKLADALLADVRRLVEVLDHPYLEDSPEATNCLICKAIAAVERHLATSPPHNSFQHGENSK